LISFSHLPEFKEPGSGAYLYRDFLYGALNRKSSTMIVKQGSFF